MMKMLGTKMRKLKGRSAAELNSRGRQALASLAELYGFSTLAKLPSDDRLRSVLSGDLSRPGTSGLFDYFRHADRPVLFGGFRDVNKSIEIARSRFATHYEESILPRAERNVVGKFDLLGFRDLDFGTPIDWQFEPVGNKHPPHAHWSRIDYLDPRVAGDKKITWELNRHQYFLTLGRAYLFTGDEQFAQCFVDHLQSWMIANPPKLGINWASNLEVAFRAISWIWALQFFKESACVTDRVWQDVLKFIYISACHLETYLSTWFSPNTHLTGEALGLYYIGTAFPEFQRAVNWREIGARTLLEQLGTQVL